MLSIHSQVNDVVWAPTDATVFASVTGDGRVEIWDLAQSTLRPIVCYHAKVDGGVVAVVVVVVCVVGLLDQCVVRNMLV